MLGGNSAYTAVHSGSGGGGPSSKTDQGADIPPTKTVLSGVMLCAALDIAEAERLEAIMNMERSVSPNELTSTQNKDGALQHEAAVDL